MKNRARRTLIGAACAAVFLVAATPLQAQAAPFVVFDIQSASPTAPPLLDIRQDGTVFLRRKASDTSATRRKLTDQQLANLRAWLLDDLHITDVRAPDIGAQINSLGATSGRLFAVADARPMNIIIHHDGGVHTVTFRGTAIAAATFPEIDALQRLNAAEQALLQVFTELSK